MIGREALRFELLARRKEAAKIEAYYRAEEKGSAGPGANKQPGSGEDRQMNLPQLASP